MVTTAEAFIARAAESSTSGKPYRRVTAGRKQTM
jgi:hypothetical protein